MAGAAPPEEIAEQVLAAPALVHEAWVPDWVLSELPVLTEQAPAHAVDLLRSLSGLPTLCGDVREVLLSELARLLVSVDRSTWHEPAARRAGESVTAMNPSL